MKKDILALIKEGKEAKGVVGGDSQDSLVLKKEVSPSTNPLATLELPIYKEETDHAT